jgi:Phosphopantetheine attachment site
MEALMKWIPRTVVVPKDRMEMNKPIHAYGIDSLTAAGLRNWFAKAFSVSFAVFEILAGASFRELGFAAAKKYKEKEKEKEKEEEVMEEEEKDEKKKTEAGEDSENRIRST